MKGYLLFAAIYLIACSNPTKKDKNNMLAGMYKLYKIEARIRQVHGRNRDGITAAKAILFMMD